MSFNVNFHPKSPSTITTIVTTAYNQSQEDAIVSGDWRGNCQKAEPKNV